MIDDKEVVPPGQVRDRTGLEAGQRLAVPGQRDGRRAVAGIRLRVEPFQLSEGRIPARVVPGDPAERPASWGHGCSAATTPAASRSFACCSLTPSSARISRVCSPVSGAPWRTNDGEEVNLIAKPGVVTSPSVGWR